LAGEIAVLLTERGLGGNDTDLTHRLMNFRNDRSTRAQNARKMAQGWVRTLDRAVHTDDAMMSVGGILALAFPDRIAKARGGGTGDVLLANGRGAYVDPADALAREPYLAIAEVQGAQARARIQLAAPLTLAEIEDEHGIRILEGEEVSFDVKARAVRARRVRRLDRLVLSEAPMPASLEQAVAALMAGVRQLGLEVLPWQRPARQFVDRLRFLAGAAPDDWPNPDEAWLRAHLETWLAPYVPGVTGIAGIGADALFCAVENLVDPAQRRRMDKEAPTHFEAPTGSHLAVNYEDERGPSVSVRVQELYGLARHPALAGGRVPLVLELLSPAHRPVQVTKDLPGFWAGSWREVRIEMRGRYPKHVWPEEPALAVPTTRAKPRGT
jgi:ATP-dependent helicase HrpB